MALMSCPDCEGKVSDRAYWCPHCGFPVREYLESLTGDNVGINGMELSDKIEQSVYTSETEQTVDVSEVEDPQITEYLKFLNSCTVGSVDTEMAMRMIFEMRKKPKVGYTLGQIAAMDFNRYENNYIVGIETISNIVYHACLLGILEPEYIKIQLIDDKAEEMQNILQERLKLSYIRRDGISPTIVGFAGDRYSITEKGMILKDTVLSNWFASELKGNPIDWDKWCDCYENYIKKYDMYDDSLFADMYIDSKIFEIINREEVLFFKNLEKHILEVEKFELKEYTEERRHQELIQLLKDVNFDSEQRHTETLKALATIHGSLTKQKRLLDSYQSQSGGTKKKASVLKRGIAGGIIAGPTGAVIGAISAVDKNL